MVPVYFNRLQSLKKLYAQVLAPLLERYALTRAEADMLMFLANNPAYDTARDIAELRHYAKSHISVGVDTLAARGLLERFYAAGNRKTVHLRLTEAARPIVAEGTRLQNRFGALLVAGFSQEEVQQLDRMLRRMMQNLDTALAAGAAGAQDSAGALRAMEETVARARAGEHCRFPTG